MSRKPIYVVTETVEERARRTRGAIKIAALGAVAFLFLSCACVAIYFFISLLGSR